MMITKKKVLAIGLASLIIALPIVLMAQGPSASAVVVVPTYKPSATVSVSEKGEVMVKNAVVFMVSGRAIFARTYWGDSYMRWSVRVSDKTNLIKRFGGTSELSDIKVGHILNVEGVLTAGADSMSIEATSIRDLNLEIEKAGFSGKVTRADDGTGTLEMTTDAGKKIVVKTDGNTVIKKGAIYIPLSKIILGDVIVYVDGTYHEPTKTISATNIEVFQTKTIFVPRNFQGKIKSISGVELPVTMVVTVGETDYTFFLNEKATVLTALRLPAKLQRFVVGDLVRLYGKIRETNLSEVDAELVRNMDL